MNIYISGLNHKTAPLAMRECLSFNTEQQREAVKALCSIPSVKECILLSTCNRTEVYIFSEGLEFDIDVVERALCEIKDINIYDYKKHFYAYSGRKAVKHLFKVASGLDSMVLGEDQILGQVKSAHELAMECGSSSVVLNRLFREAVTAAKKIKTCTELSKNSLSIASLAVKVVSDIFEGQMEDRRVLVIGAGKVGSIVLRNLSDKKMSKVYVTSRRHGRHSSDRPDYQGMHYIDYNDRYSVMDECDIIISSTTSPHYTITRDMLECSMQIEKRRVFIDLAVPRDIDTDIKKIPGVKYINIDDLEVEAGKNIDKRAVEAAKAEEIINGFVGEYEKWYEFRKVLPVVKDVQSFVDAVLDEKISQTVSRLKYASEEDREVVKASMVNAVNEILNRFVYSIQECSTSEDMETYFKCLGNAVKGPN